MTRSAQVGKVKPMNNQLLQELRQRKAELEGFRHPSPASVREHAEIIRKLQKLNEQNQEERTL